LAIFIDAGYSNALARDTFKLRIDYDEFRKQIHRVIADNTVEPLDLLRTYYYDCLPYQSNPPTPEESGKKESKLGTSTVQSEVMLGSYGRKLMTGSR
jgi:hypothetical protein